MKEAQEKKEEKAEDPTTDFTEVNFDDLGNEKTKETEDDTSEKKEEEDKG